MLAKLADHWADQGNDVTLVTSATREHDYHPVTEQVRLESLHAARQSRNAIHAMYNNWRRIWRLRGAIRKHQPDVVISFMAAANVVAMLAATLSGRAPRVIIAEHTNPRFLGLSGLRLWLARRLYPKAAHLVSISQDCSAWFEEQLNCRNVTTITNSVHLPLARQAPELTPDSVVPADVHWCFARHALCRSNS